MNRPSSPGEHRKSNSLSGADGNRPPATRLEPIFAVIALGWLVAFLLFFYSFDLPNDPSALTRFDFWLLLPQLLPPPPVNNGAPYGWQNLPQRFDLMLVAGVILTGAWGSGHLLLRTIRVPLEKHCAERTAFAFGLGIAAVSLVTLGLGLAGLMNRWLFAALLAAAIAGECVLRWRDRVRPSSNNSPDDAGNIRWICIAAVSPFVLLMLLGAMLPPTDFDVRAYHLVGPKEYFQGGKISFLEHNVYTNFPFLTEMMHLLAMVLRDDWYRGALAGQLVIALFAPLTAVALYAAGRRALSPAAGWIAATVFLTTPWVYRISIIAYSEGGLTFYLFASVLAVMIGFDRLRATNTDSNPHAIQSVFLIAGLLAGSGMACKYTGLVQVVIPIGFAVLAGPLMVRPAPPNRTRVAVSITIVFAIGVAASIGPWLLKNVAETGNPVYPLGYSVFGGRDLDEALVAQWNNVHGSRSDRLSRIGFWIVDVIARNDWLSPLLYGLAVFSCLVAACRRLVVTLWVYAAYLFVAWWALTHQIDRFWVPMIPVVALLAGIGACWSRASIWRWGSGVLMALAIWFNLGFVTTALCGYNAYLSDLKAAQESVENPGFAYLNRTLPEGSKVLVVGDGDVFDARVPIVYNTVFDRSTFQVWCAAKQPGVPEDELPLREAAEIRQRFTEAGITHLYVNWQWILTYRQPGNYGFTAFVSPHRFVELQKMGILGSPLAPAGNDPREWGVFFQEYEKLGTDDRRLLESEDRTPGNSGRKWGADLRKSIGGLDAISIRQIFPIMP